MAASIGLQPSSSDPPLESPQPPPTIVNPQTLNLQKIHTDIINHRTIIEPQTKNLQVNPNRPYCEGSSSSPSPSPSSSSFKTKDNPEEVFRVYFKGLLSDERVKMAGIGVAICNSKDEMVFEMKKPLDLSKGDRMSKQSVEGHALITALKAATDLELNRIVFCCDYYPLYLFVSGRWRPKQQKIKNFLDQVNLLRKSFTYCKHSLIARKDVKFAFKLAREAIHSQINKAVSTQEKLENCVICLDDKSIDQFFSIEGCTHRYCNSCVKQHVEVKLHNGVLPKCPHEGCGNGFRFESCEKFLSPRFIVMMRQQLKEDSIPVTERVYCPYPKCSTLMSTTEVLRLPRLINEGGAVTCYKCHGNFCISCRVPWHENMRCAEYKIRNPTPVTEESKLNNLATRNLWQQCRKCKHMIELAAGCYHMTCRCGYEFCYTCGAEWKDKKATCTCPLWIEENIIEIEEDDDFIGFEDGNVEHGVVLEDEDFENYDFEDDVVEDEDFENYDFEDDVVEDEDFENYDFEDDVVEDEDFENYDFEDDVVEDEDFENYDFEDDVVEDEDFEDNIVEDEDFENYDFEDNVVEDEDFENYDFEGDVVPGDEGDGFEHDVPDDVDFRKDVLEDEDNDLNDDEGFEHDVVLEEDEHDDFEHGVALEDDGDDFENDVLEDEGDDLNDEDDSDDLNDEDDDCNGDDEGGDFDDGDDYFNDDEGGDFNDEDDDFSDY